MRILAFYPYIPYPLDRGAYYRGYYLLKALAQDHDVDLLALAENGTGVAHLSVFTEFCHRVEFIPFIHPGWQKLFPKRLLNSLPATVAHWTLPHAAQTLRRFLATERYDAVHIFDIILAQYFLRGDRSLPLIADRTRVDMQYQLMERRRMQFGCKTSFLNLENLGKLWLYERTVAARTRLQVVCGPDDEHFLRRYIDPDMEIAVIPNGVDVTYFHPDAAPESRPASQPTVLFCGAMDYNPNVDALRWYFSQIHEPLSKLCPELSVIIVGKDPVAEVKAYAAKPKVTVTGAVPDVRPFYRQAWLQIVPLRIGGGTRLKIVESMAMGTPVVSTTIGAQGLHLEHDEDILLADAAADFVRQTARALNDAGLRQHLSHAALNTARNRLSWPMLGKRLSELYSERFETLRPRLPTVASPSEGVPVSG